MSGYSNVGSANEIRTSSFERSVGYTMNKAVVNDSIACYVYDFINGNSNNLPSFNNLKNVIDNASISNIINNTGIGDKISEGYGVTVKLQKTEQEDVIIVMEVETQITGSKSRFDVITSDKHTVSVCINGKATNIANLEKDDRRLKGFPMLSTRRIKFLQTYLNEFGTVDIVKVDKTTSQKTMKLTNKK